MKFGKRQLLIGALVAALGAAVYLNWQFSGTKPVSLTDSPESTVSQKQLGQTTYVNTEISGEEASVALEPDSGRDPAGSSEESKNTESAGEQSSSGPDAQQTAAEQCQTLTQEQREFFSSEKGKRDELQEKTMEDLTELAGAADGSESARLEAVKAAQKLADTIKMQGDIEAEVKTKGFCECIASINNSCCTVIVTKDELNDATAVTIKDIVNRQSGIGFENITITSF